MNELFKDMGPTLYELGQPGAPAVPPTPAYCVDVPAGYEYVFDRPADSDPRFLTDYSKSRRDALGNIVHGAYADLTAGAYDMSGGGTTGGSSKPVYKKVCYPRQPGSPARPGVPPTVQRTFNLGWNAGARSVASVTGDAHATFVVPLATVGAMVGFAGAADDPMGLPVISHGIEASRGVAYVVENNRRVAELGAYEPGDTFYIERSGGAMHYRVGESYDDPRHAISRPSTPTGAVWLGALLYSGSDNIHSPTLAAGRLHVPWGTGDGEMAPMLGIGGNVAYAFGTGALARMTGEGHSVNTGVGAARMARMEGTGGAGRFAFGAGAMQPITGYGQAGLAAPRYGVGIGYLTPMTSAGRLLVGNTMNGEAAMLPMHGVGADRPYGAGGGDMAPLAGRGQGLEGPSRARMWAVAGVFDAAETAVRWHVVMGESLRQQGTITVALLQTARLVSEARQDTPWFTSQELHVLMQEVVRQLDIQTAALYDVSDGTPRPIDLSEVWAVNTETGASSSYRDFGFTSFARLGNQVLGVRPDGVYTLEGATDAGHPIRAAVSFGQLDFGATVFKQVPNVYVGTSTTGALFLKVSTPQGEWVYKARRHDPVMRQQRFDLGRGLRANYYEFELYNSDGGDFELDTVEFRAALNDRRI